MGLRLAKGFEPEITHNVFSPEMLELGAVRSGFLSQGHEGFRAIKGTVMIGGNIGDEIGGLVRSDKSVANRKITHSRTLPGVRVVQMHIHA